MVGKLIDVGNAQCGEMVATVANILAGVVVRDVGHAHDDTFGHVILTQEPLQVVEHTLVVLTRVTAVDVGVHVLDVNDVLMHMGQQALQVQAVNIQGSFHRDMPLGWSDAAKGLNELTADSRLATAKGDASTRGKEIEVIDHHLVEQFGWCDCSGEAISPQALGIQAILAVQRAAVESNQRGQPLPVHRQPMSGHTNNRHPMVCLLTFH